MVIVKRSEFENSRPLDVHKWSDYPEVNDAVDHIYREVLSLGEIKRQNQPKTKKYIKILTLDLYVAHLADPTLYISYPRNHNELKNDRYNKLFIKPDLLVKVVDWFHSLGYLSNQRGYYFPSSKRQSRIRASEKLINLILGKFSISTVMIRTHEDTEIIILRDENKKVIDYVDTEETNRMRKSLKVINQLLGQTLINMYLPDNEFLKLRHRMVTGQTDVDDPEVPRGSIDFNRNSLYRIFNNSSFEQGGRFYGGWWQGIPREYRKFIKINHMHTLEADFSGMHLNLLYAEEELEMPFADPYTIEGLPLGTREIVKKSLLTIINAKDRLSALKSIRQQIREKKLVLPKGICKIEDVIGPFEEKHRAIRHLFFSGRGVFLQKSDSMIAEEIMLILASKGIPALPLHDSFLVSFPQERGLQSVMQQAYFKVTGRSPKIDNKTSIISENNDRVERDPHAIEELEQIQARKKPGLNLSEEFKKEEYSIYWKSCQDWQAATGKSNIFNYNPQRLFNKEVYNDLPS